MLFITTNKSTLTIKPHPEEVDDVKWVSRKQLLVMMDDTNLLFSPWFRLIVHKWMIGKGTKVNGGKGGWWDNLKRTINTNDFCDYQTIHRFDPPTEHMGGGGKAGPWLTVANGSGGEETVGDSS